jgi:D-alanyl-D-alanine carboxypeptidase/D-alanyl-D-alanine-endopeptidase (penicillin-binding protein 4)
MKEFIASLLAFTVTACSPGSFLSRLDPVVTFRHAIDTTLVDSLFTGTQASILIKSLKTGEVLYERNSKLFFRPASNNKLLTTAAAVLQLDSTFSFWTTLSADTPIVKGTVLGNIYLKGYGNPDLKLSDLDTLVSQLTMAGIRNVVGSIVADESYFDDLYFGEGWMWDDEPYSYQASITPLSINDNCVKVTVTPAQRPGDSAIVSIDPPTGYVSLLHDVRTVADSALQPLTISRLFMARSNTITVRGEIVAGSKPIETMVTVWQPGLYAAHLLQERLARDGIIVLGEPIKGILSSYAVPIAAHQWPLDSVLINLNKESDNLSAENLLKTMGALTFGAPGTARNGIAVVRRSLASLGVDTTQFLMVDGSGLSFYNLLTAETLVQLLEGIYKTPHIFQRFLNTLPVAGVDGTLRNRMVNSPAQGNLRAKTGTISGVSTLSGYVTSADGEPLVFSMLMQNFITPSRDYRKVQDNIGILLATFRRNSTPASP